MGSPVPRPPSSVRVSPGHSHAQPPAHGGQDSTQRPVLCPIVASFCLSQSGHSCEAASLPSSTLLSLGLRTRSFCQQQEHSPVRGRSCGCGGPGRGPRARRDPGWGRRLSQKPRLQRPAESLSAAGGWWAPLFLSTGSPCFPRGRGGLWSVPRATAQGLGCSVRRFLLLPCDPSGQKMKF